MYKLLSVVLLAAALVSCKNSGVSQPAETAPTPPATSATTASSEAPPSPATNLPAVPANTPATGTTSTALNPAHGAPGHRCDIAVGAPLNSPAGAAPPAAAVQPALPVQAPALVPPGSNVRLNPAHGLPGHDCSVPVGQPLKS